MADGFKPIRRCDVGGVSLVSADYANQLIDLINALGAATVAPSAGVGSFKLARASFTLDLSPMEMRLRAVEESGGSENIAEIKTKINEIIAALNASSGTLTCVGEGGEMAMSYPNLPGPFA